MSMILGDLRDTIISGRIDDVEALVGQAIDQDIAAAEILDGGLIAAMAEVGDHFERGQFFLPEMLVAAQAMKTGLARLRPKLVEAGVKARGKVVIGTVQNDVHDIGKNLVAMMLEGGGFEIIDLGVNVPPGRFVDAVEQHRPDIVGLSALLSTTMLMMKTTIDALTEAGLREQIVVMVGGGPVTQDFADRIGADDFALDAAVVVSKARAAIARAQAGA